MELLIFLISVIIATIIAFLSQEFHRLLRIQNRKIILIIGLLAIILSIGISSISIIDAGEVGVKVTFGYVSPSTVKEGINIINPFSKVVKYSVRLKSYTMSSARGEGEQIGDDSMLTRTINNTAVKLEMTVWYKIDPSKAFNIYRVIAANEDRLSAIVRPVARSVVRDVVATYTNYSHLNSNRQKFAKLVSLGMMEKLKDKGFIVGDTLIRDIKPPKEVDIAINKMLKREKEIQEKSYALKIAEKNKQIAIVEAQGIAASQRIINRTLSAAYLQYLAIRAQEKMAKSPNHTTVYIPVGANGIPIIRNLR